MSTIFERLDALEATVNSLNTDITNMGKHFTSVEETVEELLTEVTGIKELVKGYLPEKATAINNADLNTCIGKVIFAYGNNCSNKPTSSNGYLINIPHDSKPDLYTKQIWFSRSSDEVWVRNLENGKWGLWKPVRYDSGWIALPLASGISAYSTAQSPEYRKVNETVFIRGAVKGVVKDKTIIGTLPAGFRPNKVVSFTQNMSVTSGIANIARWQIQTDGDIEMQYDDYPYEEYDGSEWYPLDVSFLVN